MSVGAAQGTPVSTPDDGRYAIAIAGGGLVGMSLALALGRAGISVALVDASGAQPQARAPTDARPIALSQSSRRILQTLGLWDALEAVLTPIRRIHVSDRGHFGFARMRAEDHGVDALGYVISAAELGGTLRAAVQAAGQVRVLCPAVVDQVIQDHGPSVTLSIAAHGGASSQQWPGGVEAKLMVLCDGGRSPLRDQLGVPVQEREYGQWAITATVQARITHGGVAYERFTTGGPLALLPMQDNHCGLVWSVDASRCEGLMALNDDDFLGALNEQFGLRLGGFLSASPRSAFPVRSVTAARVVGERLAVIGNAANHLHPVAGQGLNLGLRDAATLAEVVSACLHDGDDPGDAEVLARYVEWRRGDQQRVARATDALVRLFSNRFAPLVMARDLGLLAFDLLPPVKRRFGRYAMGLEGRQSRLARGLEL